MNLRPFALRSRKSRKQFTSHRKFLTREVPCEWQSASSLFSTISGRMRTINLFPDLSSRGLLPFTQAYVFRDRSPLVIHSARVIPYLCPHNFFARSIAIPQSFKTVPDSGTVSSWHRNVITSSGYRA